MHNTKSDHFSLKIKPYIYWNRKSNVKSEKKRPTASLYMQMEAFDRLTYLALVLLWLVFSVVCRPSCIVCRALTYSLNDISSWTTVPNLKLFHMNVPYYALCQNCILIGFTPLNTRAARAPGKKAFKWHLRLNHRSKLRINWRDCSSGYLLPKLHKWFASLNKRAARALDKKYLQTASPPAPLVQIQDNCTALFLIISSTKIAQMVALHWTKGLPEL